MSDGRIKVRVARKVIEAEGIASFELEALGGATLPTFEAGAHIDVDTPSGSTRQYSLCALPGTSGTYQIAVLAASQSRGGSSSMHGNLEVGDIIAISTPRNHFPLVSVSGRPLLIAAGIGVTPVLCMAEQLDAQGAAFEMHYVARSEGKMAFRTRIAQARFAGQVQFHFSDREDVRSSILQVLQDRDPDRRLYVCGPASFLESIRTKAEEVGWAKDHIHFEYFAPPQSTEDETSRPFTVTLARSGVTLAVPADKTVADVLLDHGVDLPLSCEQGVCGTCVTRVLEGVPDHRDMCLTEEEHGANDQFTPCCSRSKTESLILDL